MVKRCQQAARFFQFPQPIQPHGIEPFEDIPIFPMQRRAAMFRDEALDFLKPRNDAFFPRRAAALALGFNLNAEFFQQRIIFIGEGFSHARPPPSYAPGRQPLRPCAFPKHRRR